MPRYAVVLPDAIAIRNMVLGSVLDKLQGNTLVLHGLPEHKVESVSSQVKSGARWQPLAPYTERPLAFGLRQSLAYAQMYWADTCSMRFNRKRAVKGSWRTRATAHTARLVGQLAASPSSIRLLESAYCRSVGSFPEVQEYRKLLEQNRPGVILFANQRNANSLPVVMAARSLGIPTATFVVSWDNLTSKGRIAAPFDHYLVWSDHMRRELLKYYPHVSHSRIHIVGTPQFDCYADDSLRWSREEFFSRIGGDPNRKLICYSGGDADTSPEDQEHVRILLELVRSGRIKGNSQVLVRPCPVDPGTRYNKVRADYPGMLYSQPKWDHLEPGNWSRCLPSKEDAQMLTNLTRFVDVNVNLASTMTLDFAIHDKPVVNVAFDVGISPPGDVPLWNHYYQWEHYAPVVRLGAARFAKSADEMADQVNAYLEDPSLDREARRKLVDLQLGVPVGSSATRIVDALRRIAS